VLHKKLRLRAYKIQMIHVLKPSDQVARTNFAVDMLERIDASPDLLREIVFRVAFLRLRHRNPGLTNNSGQFYIAVTTHMSRSYRTSVMA
jgi:hypothetical protein